MKKLIFIFLILLSVRTFSQGTADSIYFYKQSSQIVLLNQQNATFLLQDSIVRVGLAAIVYANEQGGFRLAQEAQKTTHANVYAEGIHAFGRFKASGYFSFKRTWQDSLAWSTKGLEQEDQPYFYASKKAGKYERQNYNLGGTLSYSLIKNRLYIASGINYLYNSTTRSVDPRPEVNTFRVKLTPELVYHSKNSYIGIQGKYGYGDEQVTLDYKNSDYQLSLGYPDRINYLVQGYGLMTISQGNNDFKRINQYIGLGLNYGTTFRNYKLKTTINYNFTKEGNYKEFANSINRTYMGYYYTDEINFLLQISRSALNSSSQLNIQYTDQNSNDANFMLYAVNYRYLKKYLNANYLVRLNTQKKLSPEFGVGGNYMNVNRKDMSTAHLLNYAYVEPFLNAGIYYLPAKKQRISMGAEIGYRKSLDNEISVPITQQNVFTKDVVFPDFEFNTSSAIKFSGNFKYIDGNIFKQFNAGLSGQISYYRKTNGTNLEEASHHIGNQFVELNLAFNLYF